MYENIVCFVARGTNSGKTYLLRQLIAEFKRRGLKVAAVKHTNHFKNVDREGKDTDTFARMGADRIILFSDHALMLYELKCPGAEYLSDLASRDVDLVLIEGFKDGPFQKIEVFNPDLYEKPLCLEDQSGTYIALVSRERIDTGLPWFPFEDLAGICAFIEERMRRK
jgi:molybdopterin-guanine dinucleotide biosynthesis protein B